MRLSLLAATLAAISSVAGAAELGSLSLVSRLGEPFDARLDVRDVKPGETIEVTGILTPILLGRMKDYIVEGWKPPKEFWED